jgi:hypothetical protein
MMEAASTSETLVNFYQTTWLNNAEDSHLHTCCCENLKSNNMVEVHYSNKNSHCLAKMLQWVFVLGSSASGNVIIAPRIKWHIMKSISYYPFIVH